MITFKKFYEIIGNFEYLIWSLKSSNFYTIYFNELCNLVGFRYFKKTFATCWLFTTSFDLVLLVFRFKLKFLLAGLVLSEIHDDIFDVILGIALKFTINE